jgi:acetyl esterase/lipase
MNTSVLTRYEIDVEDIEYIRHGGKPLLMRLYRPRGAGPFPVIVDLHGGAWCKKDRLSDVATAEPLAKSGIAFAALDFRMPPDGGYPAMLQDVNYAIRWLKSRAGELRLRADRVGILGVSSGGQTAMLAAMRPNDPRYTALPLPTQATVDATVRCAVMCWPVIDPLGRYEYAKQLKADGKQGKQPDEWISSHDQYWGSEAAMAEGSPTRILERGEKVEMPPVLYLQGTADPAHPKPNLERFIAAYRKAGGKVDMQWFEGMSQAFLSEQPDHPKSREAIEKIIEFAHEQLR